MASGNRGKGAATEATSETALDTVSGLGRLGKTSHARSSWPALGVRKGVGTAWPRRQSAN